jgi:hypothetical protein
MEDNVEEAINLLENCYERFSGCNAALIAQTLARLHISRTRKFTEAIRWAETAVEAMPHNFAIIDTVGHAYKNQLLSYVQDLTNYELSDKRCLRVLQLGDTAAKRFQEAENVYNEKRIHQSKYYADTDDNPAVDFALFTGVIGEIETLVEILKFFFNSIDFQNSNTREQFILALTKMSNMDLSYILQNVSWPWDEYYSLISKLWSRTMECFNNVTDQINFFKVEDEERRMIDKLGRFIDTVEEFIGHERIVNSKNIPPAKQVKQLRSFLHLRSAHKFNWASQYFKKDQLIDVYKKVSIIKDFSKKHQDVKLEATDLLCQLNSIMCSFFKFGFNSGLFTEIGFPELNKLALKATEDLIKNRMQVREPYLFYIMLAWPDREKIPRIYDENNFLASDSTLQKFFSKNEDQPQRNLPLFFLGTESVEGLQRLYRVRHGERLINLRNQTKIKRLVGDVDGNYIAYTLPSGVTLKIRPSDLNQVKSGGITQATFQLGFTFSGPVAYSIQNAKIRDPIAKMQALQENE